MTTQPTNDGGFKSIFLIAGLGLLIAGVYWISEVVIDLFLAGVLACALSPPVMWLNQHRCPKPLAILACYLVVLTALGFTAYFMAHAIADQGAALLNALPRYVDTLERLVGIDSSPIAVQDKVWQHIQAHADQAARLLSNGFSRFFGVLGGLANLVIVLALAFFLLSDGAYFKQTLLRLIPATQRQRLSTLITTLTHKVGMYARGQLIVMAFVGVLTWLGLSLIGVPYAFLLGILAFLLDLIPMVGPTLTFFVVALVTIGQAPALFPWAALLFIVVQQTENYILVPRILGDAVNLHPAWIFISVLAGGGLLGVPGVILAVPAAVLIQLLIHTYYLPWLDARDQSKDTPINALSV